MFDFIKRHPYVLGYIAIAGITMAISFILTGTIDAEAMARRGR